MKLLLIFLVSIPTIVLLIALFFGLLTGNRFFETISLPPVLAFLPLVSFAISIAMIFVKPNERKWRYAAIFNCIPLAIILAAVLFFGLIGFNG
ncbi:MAG: hypothetical protein KF855_16095 [Acidobacteria bacterium]|nr:hypothetical protein [Acidobacteriota bacterium]